jgi:hypothetical protein
MGMAAAAGEQAGGMPMDAPNPADAMGVRGLEIVWSHIYQPRWDSRPEAYVEHGAVAWGRSRRLARVDDVGRSFKAYVGVRHFDPSRWHVPGEPRASFFVSLFVHGRTVSLRTYPTCQEALAALHAFHATLLSHE